MRKPLVAIELVSVLLAASVVGSLVARAGFAAAPVAATPLITTVDGSTGTGPMLDIPQSPIAVSLAGSHLLVVDDQWGLESPPLIGLAMPDVIRDIDLNTGIERVVAGSDTLDAGFAGDGGPANKALLNEASAVAGDAAGDIYIADTGNNRIRKVDPVTGIITTIAGTGVAGFSGDGGSAIDAELSGPYALAVDAAGDLYIADPGNLRVRMVTPAGIITTVAGNGSNGRGGDGGPATLAQLSWPRALAVAPDGSLYIADAGSDVIRKVAPDGTISTVAGGGYSYADGVSATAADLDPRAVAIDAGGDMYIASTSIRKVDAKTGNISTIAGGPGIYGYTLGYTGDGGPAVNALLHIPEGLALAPDGTLYIADWHNDRVRMITADGMIGTLAGNGTIDNQPDGQTSLNTRLSVNDVAVDAAGNRYLVDPTYHRIRRVDASTGVVSTVAGNGSVGYSGDGGPATAASFGGPFTIAVDAVGDIYIADTDNQRVRRVDASTGIITTVAGDGTGGYTGNGGPATSAALLYPAGVALDATGNLYVMDSGNAVIRRVDAVTGVIATVAGTGRISGDAGVGGTSPALDTDIVPNAGAFDGAGRLAFIQNGFDVGLYDPTCGTITGIGVVTGDYFPIGIAADPAGDVFVSQNGRVLEFSPSRGENALTGSSGGFAGDGGPAAAATVNDPEGLAVDSSGNLFMADVGNNRVRKISGVGDTTPAQPGPCSSPPPSPSVTPSPSPSPLPSTLVLPTPSPSPSVAPSPAPSTAPGLSPTPAPAVTSGYWMLGSDGQVYPFGEAAAAGSTYPLPPSEAAVHLEATPDGKGFWILTASGSISAYGDAVGLGGAVLKPGERAVSLSATPSGTGYWIFTSTGRVIPFGSAVFFGDLSAMALNGPVIDSVATPTGKGYYLVASDGGVFAFGDAAFLGSMGGRHLNEPVVGLVPTPDGAGYWLVASDGGIFSFNAPFEGSMGGRHLNRPIIGAIAYGSGYLMVASDGGIFDFASEPFLGSLGGDPPPSPIVSVGALP